MTVYKTLLLPRMLSRKIWMVEKFSISAQCCSLDLPALFFWFFGIAFVSVLITWIIQGQTVCIQRLRPLSSISTRWKPWLRSSGSCCLFLVILWRWQIGFIWTVIVIMMSMQSEKEVLKMIILWRLVHSNTFWPYYYAMVQNMHISVIIISEINFGWLKIWDCTVHRDIFC